MEDEECCGSGCTNCVLDQKYTLPNTRHDYTNVMTDHYSEFLVKKIEKCTDNVFEFEFEFPTNQSGENTKPLKLIIPGGAHLMLRAPKKIDTTKINPLFNDFHVKSTEINSKGIVLNKKIIEKHDKTEEDKFISRPYTPKDVNEDALTFTVLIKLEALGKMSLYFQTLHLNALTEWKGPYTKIPTNIKTFSHIISFTHGVSIVPIYTFAKNILEDEDCESIFNVYACFKDIESILLRNELVRLNGYWNFQSTILLSDEKCHRSCHTTENTIPNCQCIVNRIRHSEKLICGRLDRKMIEKILTQRLDNKNDKTIFLICGSEQFSSLLKNFLTNTINENDEIHIL